MSGHPGREPVPAAESQLASHVAELTAFVGGILFEFDRDGRYLDVWTGEPGLLTHPGPELRGKSVLETLGPALGEQFVALFQRVIDTGVPEKLDYTLDVQAGRRSFRCEAQRSTDAKSERPTVTLLVRDVTEETVLQAKLVEAERLAAMGLLAASIGHEIRQPLAFASTSLEVLARELGRHDGPSPAREALDHVRDAIRRIAEIAANVRVLAPESSPEKTTEVRRPVVAAIDLCASELRGRATVLTELPGDLPRIRANEGELCQVLTNLLLNAVQATRGGRGRIVVRAMRVHDGRAVRISVEDDGCGIEPSMVERIFDPFFTTKGPGGGTGLGLFVSRRIVEASGGTLEVESELHRGTSVHILLPVAGPEESAPPSSTNTSAVPGRLRILIIDDERAFLRSLQLVLGDVHDVVVESRSPDALARVRSDPARFDAILCDLSMPEIDGVTFYQHLAALGVERRFILMTAGAFTPRAESFLRDVKCKRIVKPFAIDQLHAMLASVAGDRRAPTGRR